MKALLKSFIGTKLLLAKPMNKQDYCAYRGWAVPADEDPKEAGYLVEYTDGGKANHPAHRGYISWSPATVFKNAYREVTDSQNLNFGAALEYLKAGQAITRKGWNGRNMFAYMVGANSYPAQTGVAKAFFGEGALVPYGAYFALKGVDGVINTWVPSISDILAEDWYVGIPPN